MSNFNPVLLTLLFLSFFVALSLCALNLRPSSEDRYAYELSGVDCSSSSSITVHNLQAYKADECLQHVTNPPLYFKAACLENSAVIYLGCDSRCENCNLVNYMNFTKNCGMQTIGCGPIPKISNPMLWNRRFTISETNKQDCTSKKTYLVSAQALNTCEPLNELNKYMLTCNSTHWEERDYMKQCGEQLIGTTGGRNGVCNQNSNSITYCKSLPERY